MIDLKIVIATVILIIVGGSLLDSIMIVGKHVSDEESLKRFIITFILLGALVYLFFRIAGVTLSVFLGIVIGKIISDTISQNKMFVS